MSKQMSVTVYSFDELSEAAKDKARQWWLDGMEYSWGEESRESIEAFCQYFGISLKSWCVDAWSYDYSLSQYGNDNFRGMKLSHFDREHMPTGYCLDIDLWQTFFDVFKANGDAKHAFECAVNAGFKAWRDDCAYQQSEEYVDECLMINEYQFTENGKVW